MIFKAGEDPSYTLPLSGTLVSHQTAGFITSHFNCVPSKLACPSFVVIDSSAALLNSVLSSFNVETVRSNLRRCFNTLNFAYNTSQLRDMTFVRLCCSHVMKVFSRSLNKIETSKDAHRQITTLFAVLLNCHNVDGAFDSFEEIINIYVDPYNNQSSQRLSLLIDQSNVDEFPVEPYLEEDEEEPDFLDEIDITADAIIHQSPFNVKACDRIPVLKQLIRNESTNKKPTNPLFSIEIVHLFYKWFAYIPLWSSIMTEFVDIDTCSSNSSTHLAFNQSFGFSIKPSNPAELNSDEAFALECNSSSSSCSNFDGPLKSPKTMQSTLPTLVPYAEPSETETTDTEQNIRRSFRHRTPNSKYVDDYFKLININEKEYQFDDDDDDDNNNQDFLHTSSTYEVDKLNDFGVVVHQYLMKQYDNQKHSSVFMSGDEESWSKRGGIAGDFLACFVFLLNIS
ncbi:unnamed protein product [Rotaria sp. Silwood2]|nr:unnamed protein product [Rotaria sp. Silwood2]